MNLVLDDTIVALATAPGAAGLAVIRVSGADALRIAGRVFDGSVALSEVSSHTVHHGWAVERGALGSGARRLDEVMAAVFRAPRSYTRENVVELSCHGGDQSAGRVMAALLSAGARPARPGEFTLRAFLNGRIDLAQAEAVADLIHASTERAQALALSQLAGSLSRHLREIADSIADAAAEVEARVDFAEDVGGIEVPENVRHVIANLRDELGRWLEGAAYGRAVRDGVRVPIVGRPNVGKSSLFNALVGEPRAIVTPLPGTTRDRVSESIEVEGIRITLSDTAGLRAAEDPIEALGVSMAEQAIAGGAVVIWVVDGSRPLATEDRATATRLVHSPLSTGSAALRRVLLAVNKSDLPRVFDVEEARSLLPRSSADVVRTSAHRGEGIEEVRMALGRMLSPQPGAAAFEPVGNPRQLEALERARQALERAASSAHQEAPGEIVALELRESLSAIGEVTGSSVGEDLLERIFSRFCIGK